MMQQLELNLELKLFRLMEKILSYKYGIQLDKKILDLLQEPTIGPQQEQQLYMIYQGRVIINCIKLFQLNTQYNFFLRRDSFLHINDWIKEMKSNGNQNMVILLIGNKKDKESQRQVQTEEGQAVANENGFLFFETSAKDSINVDEAFTKLAEKITRKVDSGEIPIGDNQTIKIGAEYSFYQSKSRDQIDEGGNVNLSQEKQSKSSCC